MWWWAFNAIAAERTFDRGDFLLDRETVAVDVLRAVVPEAPTTPVPSEQDRVCRVSLRWRERVVAEAIGCHPSVAAVSEAAVRQWNLLLSPPPPGEVDLLVVWFRFPAPPGEDGRQDALQMVELGVSGVPGTTIAALPPDVRAAEPPRVQARESIRWPADIPVDQSATCDLRLAVSEEGAPFNLDVTGCDPKWVPSLRDAALGWRFSAPRFGTASVRVAVPLRIHFRDGTAAFEQITAADADLRYVAADPTRPAAQVDEPAFVAPPLPDHPPILTLHHRHFAPVDLYEMPMPVGTGPGSCAMVAQLRSDRKLRVWTEDPCAETLRDASLDAMGRWLMAPSDERDPDEVFARFRGLFLYDAEGVPRFVVDARDVGGDRRVPAGVGTYVPPEVIRQVPPKPVDAEGVCTLTVALDARGRPREVLPKACPEPLAAVAVRAVSRWLWTPPTIDGERVAATTEVAVRFR